jgi:4-amino-4-deoxy-L-arabinose transferase-like glycosyltransferase
MIFSGDEGWFYLDAKELLLGNSFPLVGITSSHNWMHQGAYWTYLLAGALFLGKFNPLAGGYLAAVIGVLTVYVCFFVGKKLFSDRVGLLFAFLYTLSPLAIYNMRLPLDTTPLPLLALLFFYTLYEWVNGKKYALLFLGILFVLLYNFELASIMFIVPFGLVMVFGMVKRKRYMESFKNKQLIGVTFLSMVLIMLPMLLYDIHHGFPQTIRFGVWLIYRIFVTVGILHTHSDIAKETWGHFIQFILSNNSRVFFLLQPVIAFILTASVTGALIIQTVRQRRIPEILLTLMTITTVGVFIIYKTPSEAYLTLFFPFLLLSLSLVLTQSKKIVIVLVIILASIGTIEFVSQDFRYTQKEQYQFSYDQRLQAVNSIIQKTQKSRYTIEGKEMFIPSPSFTMSYEYLLWYKNHNVVEEFPEKIITIQEAPYEIKIGEK